MTIRRPLLPAALSLLLATPLAAQTFSGVDAAVKRGIRLRAYPAAVVLIGDHDRVLYAKGYGTLTWGRRSTRPMPDSSLWDLASLTKVVGTTGVVARLVERGALDLDAPVVQYLPRFEGDGKARVTVRMLLDHTSGLKPYIRFFQAANSRDSAVTLLYTEPLTRIPGSSAVYSDLNAILLGFVIEKVTGVTLDEAVRAEVVEPLALEHTFYRPSDDWIRRAVPTGRDAGEPVMGVVNDRNAEFFGGVTGHAGLFATGEDVGRVARAWLAAAEGRDSSWIRPATARLFLTHHSGAGTRLLGWDTRDDAASEESSFGTRTSGETFGHTGWTGTQMWMDPVNDRWVVFLTNRSFAPRVRNTFVAIRRARAAVADAASAVKVRTAASRPN